MAAIDITRNHTLGKTAVKEKVNQVLERIGGSIGLQGAWDGDVFKITKPATGTFAISDTTVHVEIELSFLQRALKGKIEERINGVGFFRPSPNHGMCAPEWRPFLGIAGFPALLSMGASEFAPAVIVTRGTTRGDHCPMVRKRNWWLAACALALGAGCTEDPPAVVTDDDSGIVDTDTGFPPRAAGTPGPDPAPPL